MPRKPTPEALTKFSKQMLGDPPYDDMLEDAPFVTYEDALAHALSRTREVIPLLHRLPGHEWPVSPRTGEGPALMETNEKPPEGTRWLQWYECINARTLSIKAARTLALAETLRDDGAYPIDPSVAPLAPYRSKKPLFYATLVEKLLGSPPVSDDNAGHAYIAAMRVYRSLCMSERVVAAELKFKKLKVKDNGFSEANGPEWPLYNEHLQKIVVNRRKTVLTRRDRGGFMDWKF